MQLTLFHGPNVPDPMQYRSLSIGLYFHHETHLQLECCFHFSPAASFFLELLIIALCSLPSSILDTFQTVSRLFAYSCCSWGSHSKNTPVVCHLLLHWTTFCQNSPLWPICLGWPCMAGLLTSLLFKSLHYDKAVICEEELNFVRFFFWVCWDDHVFFWLFFCFCGVLHWLISMC